MYYFENIEEFKALLPSVLTSTEILGLGVDNYTSDDLEAILGRVEGYLDGCIRFKGQFGKEYQAHAFPRVFPDGYVIEKNDERIKRALCCIFADYAKALKAENTARLDLIRQGVKSINTGGVSESYGDVSDIEEIEDNMISKNYVKYLRFCLFNRVL